MARVEFKDVDHYLKAQPPEVRAVLERVRAIMRKALPKATECISYQIPAYKLPGGQALYFAGYPKHVGVYPASERMLLELGTAAKTRLHGKATLRFALDEKLPVQLLTRIAKIRLAEDAERAEAKKPAKPRKKPPAKKASSRARTV